MSQKTGALADELICLSCEVTVRLEQSGATRDDGTEKERGRFRCELPAGPEEGGDGGGAGLCGLL